MVIMPIDDLLDPVSPEQPAGADLRFTPDWDRIKEARRADDGLETGKWAKKETKTADWPLVLELSSTMLRKRTKDLQLALWLTEAAVKLRGFAGLRDGLRLTRELMARFWDSGLFPAMEDGPEDRAGPFEWLNDKLVDAITAIPMTAREDGGQDFSFIDLQDARRTGSEASCLTADGEVDSKKKKAYEAALANGHASLEMFDRAIAASKRKAAEELDSCFRQTHDEFKALDKLVDEKFGEVAPSLSVCRRAFSAMSEEITNIVERKRQEEPDPAPAATAGGEAAATVVPGTPGWSLSLAESSGANASGSWYEAEALIRTGQVDRGLAQMVQLSAQETSGRNRFQRKLLLADVCLNSKRERLARSILEELAEQIDKMQLEAWESTELIASVWTRLYKLYKHGEDSNDRDRANKLYQRLSRLDPWQALSCGEG